MSAKVCQRFLYSLPTLECITKKGDNSENSRTSFIKLFINGTMFCCALLILTSFSKIVQLCFTSLFHLL